MTWRPMMTDAELRLLESFISRSSRVWEWGAGESSLWLAERVRHVTSVEHDPEWASALAGIANPMVCPNLSVFYVPPDQPYVEGTDDDGDLDTFRSYISCYTGAGIDVVILDGRARVECARYARERAPYGPYPDQVFLLHDADREQYDWIWKDQPARECFDEEGSYLMPAETAPFEVLAREDNLIALRARF